ncbi:Fibrillarin-like rRNA/tRNA 2'-O-methyltransferase [Trichinella pseudospiralis]|uniref:Uncharacterized protein n=2 Tax=Trichinella pseudospiralis TaxID=6337 RepID=A0A0V1F619_TRIPS|nr:hypothetical protein T4D_9839 [Trichinella pseudospiralis]
MKILFCIQLFSIIFTICANNNATQNKVTNQKEIQDYLQNRNNYMLVEMDAKEVKNESILQEMMNDEIMEHAFTVGYGLMAGIFVIFSCAVLIWLCSLCHDHERNGYNSLS